MSFKEVKELRQKGNLDEALSIAERDLAADAENIWNKRSIAWVYYSILKENTSADNIDQFIDVLKKIRDLALPTDENMFFDNLAFVIGKYVFLVNYAMEEKQTDDLRRFKSYVVDINLKNLFDIIVNFSFTKPSAAYSFVFKAFHSCFKESLNYVELVEWFDMENFMPEDFRSQVYNDNKIMSLVEQVLIAYSKSQLLGLSLINNGSKDIVKTTQSEHKPHIKEYLSEITELQEAAVKLAELNRDRIPGFIQKMDTILADHPEYQYPHYFKAKLLLALGENEKTLSSIRVFAKRNQQAFWVWDFLSEIHKDDDGKVLSCLSRALTCSAPEKMLVSVKEKLLGLLIKEKLFGQAKWELDDLIRIRNAQKWNVSKTLSEMLQMDWYKSAEYTTSNQAFYEKHKHIAEELLFDDTNWSLAVIDSVNKSKRIAHFIVDKEVDGLIKFDKGKVIYKEGDFVEVKLETRKSRNGEDYYVPQLVRSTVRVNEKLMKKISGVPRIIEARKIAFVEDAIILPYLFDTVDWNKVDNLNVSAIINYNRTKSEWGWKVYEVNAS
jgi:hypothetical protein